ncbi:histidinol phosphate phosphatase domain-containing protein [Lysinibacillus cavernae]|uniref:histidinol phosphate phosphatase domain-containing protein n=1 Tax=Lysinibacillus cavernae TaxID=2666135 RepID=UPI0012D9AAD9|nr:histidinol phosphate phosphatase domain-containing protein [Lysinibacillus cavernae]
MTIDYHVHLEEGPYSFRWLERTSQALEFFHQNDATEKGSKEQMTRQLQRLANRVQSGCYSEEWLDLYLEQAKQLGLREVGIVDHLYRFKETRAYFERFMKLDDSEIGQIQRYWLDRVMTENIDVFVSTIQQAKEKWHQHGIALRLGIEADYFSGGEEELSFLLADYPWDYVIGSVHFVDGWGFDNPQTQHLFEQMDQPALQQSYEQFFKVVETMILSNMFDFVAHLDNFKVFNYQVEDQAFLEAWYKRIAQALTSTQTATEINAGLHYRYPVKEMCPGPRFLQTLLAHGVAFTVSSDAHFPDDLGKYTFANTELLKRHSIQSIVAFEQRVKKFIEL